MWRPRWRLVPVVVLLSAALGCLRAGEAARGSDATRGCPGEGSVTVQFSDPRDAAFARRVREALPAALPVAGRFGAVRGPVTITIHPTHSALEAAAGKPGYAWLRAWARADSIALQAVRTWTREEITDEELHTLLVHELTHCAMYQAIGPQADRNIPIWFREGMAAFTADERFAPPSGAPAGPASYRDDAPRAYAHAERTFRRLVERAGDAPIRRVLARVRAGARFAEAFRESVGVGVEEFEGGPLARASAQAATQR